MASKLKPRHTSAAKDISTNENDLTDNMNEDNTNMNMNNYGQNFEEEEKN